MGAACPLSQVGLAMICSPKVPGALFHSFCYLVTTQGGPAPHCDYTVSTRSLCLLQHLTEKQPQSTFSVCDAEL